MSCCQAGGSLNPLIIAALQSLEFEVSAIVRKPSAAVPPPGVHVHHSDLTHSSLVSAFQGQNVVVNMI